MVGIELASTVYLTEPGLCNVDLKTVWGATENEAFYGDYDAIVVMSNNEPNGVHFEYKEKEQRLIRYCESDIWPYGKHQYVYLLRKNEDSKFYHQWFRMVNYSYLMKYVWKKEGLELKDEDGNNISRYSI